MWGEGMGPFFPSPGTFMAQEGSKVELSWSQNRTMMAGLLRGEDPFWKLFYEPYHTSLHGKTCFTVISALSMHPGAGGVQNMAIFGSKYTYYGRVVQGRWVPPGNCL